MLRSGKIRIVQFEYGYGNGDARFLMRDFYELFEEYGYKISKVNNGSLKFSEWTYKNNDFKSGPNYVAVRRDDAELIAILTR